MNDFICAKCGAPNGDGFEPDYYTPPKDYDTPMADAAPMMLDALCAVRDLYGPGGDFARNAVRVWEQVNQAIAAAEATAPDSAPAP